MLCPFMSCLHEFIFLKFLKCWLTQTDHSISNWWREMKRAFAGFGVSHVPRLSHVFQEENVLVLKRPYIPFLPFWASSKALVKALLPTEFSYCNAQSEERVLAQWSRTCLAHRGSGFNAHHTKMSMLAGRQRVYSIRCNGMLFVFS